MDTTQNNAEQGLPITNTLQLVIEKRAKDRLKKDLIFFLNQIKKSNIFEKLGNLEGDGYIYVRPQDEAFGQYKPEAKNPTRVQDFLDSLSNRENIVYYLKNSEEGIFYKRAFSALFPIYVKEETEEMVNRLDKLENDVNDLRDGMMYNQ